MMYQYLSSSSSLLLCRFALLMQSSCIPGHYISTYNSSVPYTYTACLQILYDLPSIYTSSKSYPNPAPRLKPKPKPKPISQKSEESLVPRPEVRHHQTSLSPLTTYPQPSSIPADTPSHTDSPRRPLLPLRIRNLAKLTKCRFVRRVYGDRRF